MNKLPLLIRSRKFWAALIAFMMVFVTHYIPDFPISEDQILSLVAVIVSYILGTALEDGLSRSISIKK